MKTAILIIMFTRSSTLEKVFHQVAKAKPQKLYLFQDGPRSNYYESDMVGIMRCREIVSHIDWPCTVIKNYQEKNIGCDPGSFYAYSWFFSNEKKGIILEDDAEASLSFFQYCEELLDYYETNNRIYRICGQNIEWNSRCEDSYFFSRKGATGSWASWQRVACNWDPSYKFLDNESTLKKLKERFENTDYYNQWIQLARSRKEEGIPYYETIFYEDKIERNMLDIIPKVNLVSNIGQTSDAVHNQDSIMPTALKKCFNAPRFQLEFPMTHPKVIAENMRYTRAVNKALGFGHPFLRFKRKWEVRIKKFIHSNNHERKKMIKKYILFSNQHK